MIVCYCLHVTAQQKPVKRNNIITIIQDQFPKEYKKNTLDVMSFPISEFSRARGEGGDTKTYKINIKNSTIKWSELTEQPRQIYWGVFENFRFILPVAEPGDSILIKYNNGKLLYAGKGVSKYELVEEINTTVDSLEQTSTYKNLSYFSHKVSSVQDYLAWNKYLNVQIDLLLPLIEKYKSRLSYIAYNSIKERTLQEIEGRRITKFNTLRGKGKPNQDNVPADKLVNAYDLTNSDLAAIYDSTLNGPAAKWLQYSAPIVSTIYYLNFVLYEEGYRSKKTFFKLNQSDTGILGDGENHYIYAYNLAKVKYQGIIRESVLATIIIDGRGIIYEAGFSPKVEKLLVDYFAQPGFPAIKNKVRKYVQIQRERQMGKKDIDFSLTDINGNTFSKAQLKGKVAIMDFWFTGCTGCVQMASSMKNVEQYFKNDTNVVFVNVSIDENKETWLKSISKGKYTTGYGINLYTGGEGKQHQIIRNYGVVGYPTLFLFDGWGRMVRNNPRPDPRKDNGKLLIEIIQKQLAFLKDGPYILHTDDSATVYYINGNSPSVRKIKKSDTLVKFDVQSDMNKRFEVTLQRKLVKQPAEFEKPEKLIVFSDIEGNFDALRKLLQKNNVIDENYNWIFGKGHLAFVGDMFDRGKQVTECLWLIYSLEEKAIAAGGYVHYILGNHELMNLRGDKGDLNYVQPKYHQTALILGKDYVTKLYGSDSELGRWLRTKNIIERIGDVLLLHAGISKEINQLDLSLSKLNDMARPYYSEKVAVLKQTNNHQLLTIYGGETSSPFWFRNYYEDDDVVKKSMAIVIDSTLRKFNVSRIVTGHTVVADTVSVHFNGKVINTDTKHAEGKSEALLIDGERYYRVNGEGEKKALMVNFNKVIDYTRSDVN
jgi:cytochrome oxidase Cu insertion factor (SCO1/SenC/PrrC family)